MDDLISRQAVFNTVTEYRGQLCEIFGDENELIRVVDIVKHRLIALPSAQPDLSSYSDKLWRSAYERGKAEAQAEIVRCKDCKYSHDEYGDGDCYCKRPGRTMDWIGQRWDYYRANAKRRTDEPDK